MHPDNLYFQPKPGKGYVYKISSGRKTYIGISTTPWQYRWSRHCSPDSGCTKLVKQLNLLKKTGRWEQLQVQIIKEAKDKSLDSLQKKYIKQYNSFRGCFGLNSTPGGRDITPGTQAFKRLYKKARKRVSKKTKLKFTWDQV